MKFFNWRFAENQILTRIENSATVLEYVVFCCASTDTLQEYKH
jgi:hypothetical protein